MHNKVSQVPFCVKVISTLSQQVTCILCSFTEQLHRHSTAMFLAFALRPRQLACFNSHEQHSSDPGHFMDSKSDRAVQGYARASSLPFVGYRGT